MLRTLHDRGFAELRPRHGYVVQRLLVAPQTATELAASLGVTQQAVSKLAAELVGAGYVRRADSERDARRRPLELTDRGRAVVAAARSIRAQLESRVAQAVGDRARLDGARAVADAVLDAVGLAGAVAGRRVPLPAEDY